MRRARLGVCAILALTIASSGCQTGGGGIGALVPGVGPSSPDAPPTVREQTGKGRLPVHGASLYGPGQKIYKELRQEESLMAFLACQGEPDAVEVVAHPGAPKIYLYYSRRGLDQKGTVEIAPSREGFYAAQPINPNDLGPRPSPPPPKPKPKPAPKPKPKPAPKPTPVPEPEPPPAPEPEAEPPALEEPDEAEMEALPEPEPEPPAPQPTRRQLDDCPIEPWRRDCQELCTGDDPAWEWCDYDG